MGAKETVKNNLVNSLVFKATTKMLTATDQILTLQFAVISSVCQIIIFPIT